MANYLLSISILLTELADRLKADPRSDVTDLCSKIEEHGFGLEAFARKVLPEEKSAALASQISAASTMRNILKRSETFREMSLNERSEQVRPLRDTSSAFEIAAQRLKAQ